MNYYCLNENEDGVVCGRKIEGEFDIWLAEHVNCVCRPCLEDMQRIDYKEMGKFDFQREIERCEHYNYWGKYGDR